MPTNQLAPPDMPWLTGNVASPPNGLGPPQLNYAAPPPDASTSQGAAIADTGQAAWQWLQDQRAESVRQGLLDPNTGLPTQAGLVAAAGQTAQGVMMGTTAPGDVPPPGIVAYHGSPADFDRFSDDFIGTGEGAQAYGRGHYFGGAEQTAINYRDQLSSPTTPDQLAAHYLAAMGGNRGQAMAQLQHNATFDQPPADAAALLQAHELLKSGATPNPTPAGHMYQVNIAADPEHFLDWDKPLSEQHPKVQEQLADVLRFQKVPPKSNVGAETTGGLMMQYLDSRLGSVDAANELASSGVPGIRYLDQGSRGAGQGSHNYVVFDANTIDILRKYGIAGLIAGGGAAAAGTQQQQPQPTPGS